uniref:Uncharacterized protein n=1 Tax=Panagrolaimus superbus TaxID=310955 RepID=A0A914YK72_9BILA
MDQSFASESSAAFEDTTIPFEDFTTDIMECEKEITKEISLELPDSSAEAVFVYPQTQKIVCDPLVTKAISKKKVFIETTFKASKQRERIKHTVPIKSKAKVKARIVVSSKTKSVDFEFKKSCQKKNC